MRIQITLALLIFTGLIPAVRAGEDSKTMALSDTPPAVQSTITNQVADGALGDIDRTNEDGETTYEVTFTPKGGEERDFSVAEDGSLLSVEMLLPEVKAVRGARVRSTRRVISAASWSRGKTPSACPAAYTKPGIPQTTAEGSS